MANRGNRRSAPPTGPEPGLETGYESVSRDLPLWGNWHVPGLGPAAILLFVLTLVTFSNSFQCGLVLDNGVIIGDDIRLRPGKDFKENWEHIKLIFKENYWWPSLASDLYRPLTTLSYKINYSLIGGGADPKLMIQNPGVILQPGVTQNAIEESRTSLIGFHVINMLLHWINSLLVFALIRRIVLNAWGAVLGACIFAVHPVVVESVTNIVGRADLLATMCVLSTLVLHIRAYQVRGVQRAVAIIGMGLISIAGIFCKENAIVIIGAMPLYDVAFAAEKAIHGRWRVMWTRFTQDGWLHYVAVAPALVILVTARIILMQNSPVFAQVGVDNPIAKVAGHGVFTQEFWTGEFTAIKVVAYYLQLLLWPSTLSCDYSHHEVHLYEWGKSPQDWHMFIGLAIVVATGAAGILAYIKRWRSFFFLGFFIGAFLPTSNLLITIGTIMAERILYLPMVGFVGVIAAVSVPMGRYLMKSAFPTQPLISRALLAGVATVAIVAMATRSYLGNDAWYDEDRLWTNAMQACPHSFKVYKGLALVRAKADAGVITETQGVSVRAQAVQQLVEKAGASLGKVRRHPEELERITASLREAQSNCIVVANGSAILDHELNIDLDRAAAIEVSLDPAAPALREKLLQSVGLTEQVYKQIGELIDAVSVTDGSQSEDAQSKLETAKKSANELLQLTLAITKGFEDVNSLLLEREIIPMAEKGYQVLQDNMLPLIHLPGQLYLDLGHYYASMGDRAAAKSPPGSPLSPEAAAWYAKSIKILGEGQDIDRAVNSGSRATRLQRGVNQAEIIDVGNPNVYHDLGVVSMRLGNYKDALTAFSYQLKLDPLSKDAYFNVGVCHAVLQQQEEAALDFITALILGNSSVDTWANLARIYEKLAPEPQPIQQVNQNGNPSFSLNVNNPVVRDHVNKAFYRFIENLILTKRFNEARAMRQVAAQQFGCPDKLFAPLDVALSRFDIN